MTQHKHSIELTATASNWRLFMTRKADQAFQPFQSKIWRRDDFTCQFCGLRTQQGQEVVNLDGNYRNNKISNLVTACPICCQCFFLESVGKGEFGGGSLILLPEMSQVELNALIVVLFTAINNGLSYAAQAKAVYRSFKIRTQPIEKQLGEGMSDPMIYGRLLVESDPKDMEKLKAGFAKQLRLLPDILRFSQYIEAWSISALNQV